MPIELTEGGGELIVLKMLDGSTARVKLDLWEADAAYSGLFREHYGDLPERPDGTEPSAEQRTAEREAYAGLMRGWRDWLVSQGFPAGLTVKAAADVYDALRKKKEPSSGGPESPASTTSTPGPSKPKKSGRSKR